MNESRQYRTFRFQNLRRQSYFEGWYYKIVSSDEQHMLSIIFGLSKKDKVLHPFIQVIYGHKNLGSNQWQVDSDYIVYSDSDLFIRDEPFSFRLGNNRFMRDGLAIDIQGHTFKLKGELSFEGMVDLPATSYMPTIMGPFSYLPFMECIHSVNSLSHTLKGSLDVNGQMVSFSRGKGYIEKDWGSSFPKRYIWLQSNHFREEGSLFFSWADIPIAFTSFEGYIAHLYYRGVHHRYATYTRGSLKLDVDQKTVNIQLTNAYSTLTIQAIQGSSAVLRAPHKGEMVHSIKEGLFGTLSFEFLDHKHGVVIKDETQVAGMELVFTKQMA